MKALIAAGGRGTRLRPITFTSNKHLIPVANKPILLYPLEAVVATGIKEVGVVVNETRPEVEALLGDGSKWGVRITYILQPAPGGLADCVRLAEGFMGGEPFVFHLGDNILTEGIKEPTEYFLKVKPNALAVITRHEEPERLGVAMIDKKGHLIDYLEHPENPPDNLVIVGVYYFDKHIFEAFKGRDAITLSARGELEIADAYRYLIKRGFRVDTFEIQGFWKDPGKMDDLLDANRLILDKFNEHLIEGKVDKESEVSGDVRIEKGSVVKNSVIRGPVVIGRNVVIENSYVGPFTSIYHDCVIKNCELENSVLLKGARLENIDRRIDRSLIGNNAQVLRTDTKPRSYNFLIGDMSQVDLI